LQEFGIPFPGTAHQAIHDARATAKLIEVLFQQGTTEADGSLETDREWPSIPPLKTAPVTRQTAQQKLSKAPDFLRRIVAKTHHDTESVTSDVLAYLALIDRILEDRVIDSNETEILVDAAGQWNLGPEELRQAHSTYIHSLAIRALADGIVTDAERNDLHEVARLVGFDRTELDKMLDTASRQLRTALPGTNNSTSSEDLGGKRVCFTGELASCIDGEPITRDMAEALAEKAGLIVLSGVTKSLDILVVADPNTQSGKAKKARQYGIRILAEPVFWHTIDIKVDDYARGAAE
jgi:DNA polymerase-3 subunit epsilon